MLLVRLELAVVVTASADAAIAGAVLNAAVDDDGKVDVDELLLVFCLRFLLLALASSSIRRTVSEIAAKSSSGLGSLTLVFGNEP